MKQLLGWLAAVLAVHAFCGGIAPAQDAQCNTLDGVAKTAPLGVARVVSKARLHFTLLPGSGRAHL